MKKVRNSRNFDPKRVETFFEWRLQNSASPVKEQEFRQRLRKSARRSNQTFDELIVHFNESEETIPQL
jgi:hypothetical protein